MRILDAEIKLRDGTREAEQIRASVNPGAKDDPEMEKIAKQYSDRAAQLSDTQDGLARRTLKVIEQISELENAEQYFAKEMQLLAQVTEVMIDATDILGEPDTGARAVGAETEAIELLLQTKRMSGGGGGGGANPGGGGGGTTSAAALALLGDGVNPKGQFGARSVQQQTGKTGRPLPAEFRRGLDKFLSLPSTDK